MARGVVPRRPACGPSVLHATAMRGTELLSAGACLGAAVAIVPALGDGAKVVIRRAFDGEVDEVVARLDDAGDLEMLDEVPGSIGTPHPGIDDAPDGGQGIYAGQGDDAWNDQLDQLEEGVSATNRTVTFDDAATSAANRLGFDPFDVTVTNGVADVPIIFTSSVSPSDITRVTRTLQEQGVSSVRINSGPIINETITPRLARAADEGRTFMGFNVVRTGDPENMFALERSLQ